MTDSETLLLAAKCFEDGGPLEDWLFDNGPLIAKALRAYAQRATVTEETLAGFICDVQDRLGPGCDELAIARAILEKFQLRDASAQEVETPAQSKPLKLTTSVVEDLPLYWQGRANALRILDEVRDKSDAATLWQADAFEECAKELHAALALLVEQPQLFRRVAERIREIDPFGDQFSQHDLEIIERGHPFREFPFSEYPCPRCGGSGFEGRGSGYDDVCSECDGCRYFPSAPPQDDASPQQADARQVPSWEDDPRTEELHDMIKARDAQLFDLERQLRNSASPVFSSQTLEAESGAPAMAASGGAETSAASPQQADAQSGPACGVPEALRLLRKIADLVDAEDVGEPLDDAISYANKAIAALSASPQKVDTRVSALLQNLRDYLDLNSRPENDLAHKYSAEITAVLYAASSKVEGCVCQDQHRRGWCTEPGCPFRLQEANPQTNFSVPQERDSEE